MNITNSLYIDATAVADSKVIGKTVVITGTFIFSYIVILSKSLLTNAFSAIPVTCRSNISFGIITFLSFP